MLMEGGLFFAVENPGNLRLAGTFLLMLGTGGVTYAIYKNSRYAGPVVDGLRYGPRKKGQQQGLYVCSTGEPAYGVHVLPVAIGAFLLHFDETLNRLRGDGFVAALVSRGHDTDLDLESVWSKLKLDGAEPGCIPLVIRYRDAEGHYYKTTCELRRNVMRPASGFDVQFVGRTRIGPLENLRGYLKGHKPRV